MKRLNRIIALILLISTIIAIPVSAAPNDRWVVNSIDNGGNSIGVTESEIGAGKKAITQGHILTRINQSKKYYAFTVYELDGGIWKFGIGDIVNAIANVIFSIAKLWMEFVARVTYHALNFDLYKLGQKSINSFISKLTKLTGNVYGGKKGFAPIIWFGVALSFCLVILMFARGQTSSALGKFIAIIFVLALISGYATIPSMFMKGAQSTVQSAGQSILKTQKGNAKEAVATQIWVIGVDMPWQQLEFGHLTIRADDGGVFGQSGGKCLKWLSTFPDSREDAFRGSSDIPKGAQANATNSGVVQGARAGEAVMIVILDFAIGLVFLSLAAIALGFQVGSIIMWIMGFFVFIVALFPTHSMNKIKDWLGMLAMTYFGQLVVYVIILLVLQIVSWFYEAAKDLYTTIGFMIGAGVGLKMMAGPIMQLFSGGGSGATTGRAVVQGLNSMRSGVSSRVGGYRGNSTEGFMPSPTRGIRMNKEAKLQGKKEAKVQQYREAQEAREAQKQARRERVANAVQQKLSKSRQSEVAMANVQSKSIRGEMGAQSKSGRREVMAMNANTQVSAGTRAHSVRSSVDSVRVHSEFARETKAASWRSENAKPSYTETVRTESHAGAAKEDRVRASQSHSRATAAKETATARRDVVRQERKDSRREPIKAGGKTRVQPARKRRPGNK